jgi:hypothetical protein
METAMVGTTMIGKIKKKDEEKKLSTKKNLS